MNRLIFTLVLLGLPSVFGADVQVPALTAYLEPDAGGARRSDRGITNWIDPETSVIWFGQLKSSGSLEASVQLQLASESSSRLKLSIGGQSKTVTVTGQGDKTVSADFGAFEISQPGYHSFVLQHQNPAGQAGGNIQTLVLTGEAVQQAHFNLKPRRNAASVHLMYPVDRELDVSAFYCEMTGLEDPVWTYYMACGWHRGYFGMQVNSPTERRIIFSVWDSGNEAVDRARVADENRVTLVDKGPDVYSGDFGNEGTGGHSHLKFQWKTGEKQRFLVMAEPVSPTQTIYAGYYFRPDQQKWMLISSWKAPKEGGYMRGLYSFSENFVGRNGHLVRRARFGNQWIRTADGTWRELTTAKFSHDGTGRADRLDRFMGIEAGEFFLSHGGFVDGHTDYGVPFERPPSGRSPADMELPPLPDARTESAK
ncbi:MAG: DUF3472 domain-containing protein [Fuerstiella sp.]